jgi:4-azaleucine resistance transporter AzlC
VAYGAVASRGLAIGQTMLMSVALFAGTAQFVAASMIAERAAFASILITSVLINLRLVLMSAALTPYVRQAPRALQPFLAHALTDESFAVSIAEYERGGRDPLYLLGSGLAIFSFWQVASALGALGGANIPAGLGLEYALPGSLICLLFLLVRDRYAALIALLAAGLSLALRPLVSGTWSTMTATLLAATLGVVVKRWRSRS